MKEAIIKAIEGGYLKQNGANSVSVEFHKDETYTVEYADSSACHFNFGIENNAAHKFLNPLFWQALSKSLGWDSYEDPQGKKYPVWQKEWHRFVDALAEGQTPDQFFTTLLSN